MDILSYANRGWFGRVWVWFWFCGASETFILFLAYLVMDKIVYVFFAVYYVSLNNIQHELLFIR